MFSHLHHTQLSDLFKIINDKVFKSALDEIDVHFNPRLMACAGRYNLTKGFLRKLSYRPLLHGHEDTIERSGARDVPRCPEREMATSLRRIARS
jgi:hypothetical protein